MTVAERLDRFLLAWLESRIQGRELPASELCRDSPELLPLLAERIQALGQLPSSSQVSEPITKQANLLAGTLGRQRS